MDLQRDEASIGEASRTRDLAYRWCRVLKRGGYAVQPLEDYTGVPSDAVKVGHHGSRTSSTEGFVNASRPALAVVSVGQDSPYGHPHPEVLERWRASGAQVLTTGQRGTITVSTDGDDLKVETFVKP